MIRNTKPVYVAEYPVEIYMQSRKETEQRCVLTKAEKKGDGS